MPGALEPRGLHPAKLEHGASSPSAVNWAQGGPAEAVTPGTAVTRRLAHLEAGSAVAPFFLPVSAAPCTSRMQCSGFAVSLQPQTRCPEGQTEMDGENHLINGPSAQPFITNSRSCNDPKYVEVNTGS